jgi:predicted dehydrogenase
MDTIRIGFIGLGGIYRQRHMPGLQKIDGLEFTAVVNQSRESSERAAEEFGIATVCDSWEELVARDDIDAVCIGTWPYMHKPMSIAALEAGKHVFCQARMAMNYAEAQAMYDVAQRTGLVAMLCPVPFGLSIDKTMAKHIERDDLGDITLVRVNSMSGMFADPEAPMNWRKAHRLSGLNMHTLGMYIEVIHRWFGRTKSVSAQSSIVTPQRVDDTGERIDVEIPDQYLLNTITQSGVPVQYTVSTVAHHGVDEIHIHGTKQTLYYDVHRDQLYSAAPGETMGTATVASGDEYNTRNWRVESDFINAIRTGSDYYPNFEDGLRYMQVVQAAHDSAASGQAIELD